MLRLVDVGGSWWLTMTPVEGMTWVYDRIYEPSRNGRNPDIYVVEAAMDMNTHINIAEVDVYLAGMSEDDKNARRKGKFVQVGGLIYAKSFAPERNVIPSIISNEEKWSIIRDKWTHFMALDHGFNNPTAVLWLATDSDGRIIVYDEYYISREVISYHARKLKSVADCSESNRDISLRTPAVRNTDPITGTSVLIEYTDQGLPFVLGNNDVRAGINRVARLFEEGQLKITQNCEKTLWELGRYRWSKYASSKIAANNNVKEEPVKKDDHLMDALRYGVASRFTGEEHLVDVLKESRGFPEVVNRETGAGSVDLELLKLAHDQSEQMNFDSILGSDW